MNTVSATISHGPETSPSAVKPNAVAIADVDDRRPQPEAPVGGAGRDRHRNHPQQGGGGKDRPDLPGIESGRLKPDRKERQMHPEQNVGRGVEEGGPQGETVAGSGILNHARESCPGIEQFAARRFGL